MIDSTQRTDATAQADGMLALARGLITLKSVARTGWLDRGVDPRSAESVADHSLGVALLAWACALERQREGVALDPQRVLLLALVHDLPEAETGDTPPYDPDDVPGHNDPAARRAYLDRRHVRDAARDAAKRAREDSAMRALLAALPPASRSALSGIWEELLQGTSAEARFVKEVDQLETFLQSLHYGERDADLPIDSFRREVLETLDDPLLRAIRDTALGTRSERVNRES